MTPSNLSKPCHANREGIRGCWARCQKTGTFMRQNGSGLSGTSVRTATLQVVILFIVANVLTPANWAIYLQLPLNSTLKLFHKSMKMRFVIPTMWPRSLGNSVRTADLDIVVDLLRPRDRLSYLSTDGLETTHPDHFTLSMAELLTHTLTLSWCPGK